MKTDKVEGFLEVGTNGKGEMVINHPDLKPDENGVGHVVNLARIEVAKQIPVDRTARVLTDGSPIELNDDHLELKANGQQKEYVVLNSAERAKGFVRPVRTTYVHVGLNPTMHGAVILKAGVGGCGTRTTMAQEIAETYARDPKFYIGTFCWSCRKHLPVDQFYWEGTTEQVGS